jgi:hypothetical protein
VRRRDNKKIVSNHSSLIPGLKEAMCEIAAWDEVDSVVPGRIRRGGHTSNFVITIQRSTISGLRCIAKRGSGNQALFITTSKPDRVRELLNGASFTKPG